MNCPGKSALDSCMPKGPPGSTVNGSVMKAQLQGFFFIILFALYVPVALLDYAHFPYSDGAEHGAAVRALAENLRTPGEPMLNADMGKSSRYVPSIFLMALFSRMFGCDVLTTLKVFLVAYFGLFVSAVWLFARSYFDDAGKALFALAALLFLWGTGWKGANAYMFSAILYTSYFPSVVSFSLSLLALYCQVRFVRTTRKGFFLAEMLIVTVAFVNHPPTGVFLFICAGFLFVELCGFNKTLFFRMGILAACTLAGLKAWPYYDFFAAFSRVSGGEMSASADYGASWNYLHSGVLIRTGTALAGIPFLLFLLKERRNLFITGSCLTFVFVYVGGYFLHANLSERFIFFIVFCLQLAFACMVGDVLRKTDTMLHRVGSAVLLCVLGLGFCLQTARVYHEYIVPRSDMEPAPTREEHVGPNRVYRQLARYIGSGDVVISDYMTSWSLPVYTGARIMCLYHTPPHVSDNKERLEDNSLFFNHTTGNKRRWEIIKKYGITHVLLYYAVDGLGILPRVRNMGLEQIVVNREYALFAVPE